MKKVIREGVFETNSSSTHAVVFKKRESNEIERNSSREIHTAFGKTAFLIGLINYAENFCYEEFVEPDLTKIIESFGEDWHDSMLSIFKKENPKILCAKFKDAVISEYLNQSGLSYEAFEQKLAQSSFARVKKFTCAHFFTEGCLDDCTCPFEGFRGIARGLSLTYLSTDEDFKKKAKEYLSDDYIFTLTELYAGVSFVCDKKIY